MADKFYQPTRMCIACRTRESQKNLLRLQCHSKMLQGFSGEGRSFYLCYRCLEDDRKTLKSLMRVCKTGEKEGLMNKLKEMIAHERKS